jgi:hypothetical protein
MHALARLIRQFCKIQDDPVCFDAKKMMSRSLRTFADGTHSEKIDMAGDDLQDVPMVVEYTRNTAVENDPLELVNSRSFPGPVAESPCNNAWTAHSRDISWA